MKLQKMICNRQHLHTLKKGLLMKKNLFLFKGLVCSFLSLCFAFTVNAQSKIITGQVIGKDNLTLGGATVKAKGATTTTQTKEDGSFSIEVPSTVQALVFSYVGYNEKEVPIGTSSVVNVTLDAGAESLQDVVVIGYGTRRKS